MSAPGIQGPTAERLALARRVATMRAGGMFHRDVAETLGISRSYAAELASDPDGSRARARKDSYRGACIDCGRPTSGSNGTTGAPERCAACRKAYERSLKFWTRERVIDAIQRFAAEHGRPPKATEWNIAHSDDDYPASSSVYVTPTNPTSPFASWADAIEAAGFPRPAVGKHERTGEVQLSYRLTRPLLAWLREQTEPVTIYDYLRDHPRGAPWAAKTVYHGMHTLMRRGLAVKVRRELGQGGKCFYEAVR